MDDVFQWLDQWWFLYSEWFPDPEPLTGPKWDTLVYRGTRLPDVVNDVDIRPLKRLLRAMVAWGAPSIINGPQLSPERLQEVSSEAWAAYQQLYGKTATGEAADDELSEERRTGEWAKIFGVDSETIRNWMDAEKVGRTLKYRKVKFGWYRIHHDEFPEGLRSKVSRDRKVKG